ncbi:MULTISPECIES: DUF1631 domain-containing protein [Halomonadaceae]|uniref:DUF1631 family protein n=2 Tax=Bacteria TaxID=2 RepID=A0A9X4Y9K5_9GAMM|nr:MULTISPECIES: DUF1631 domain-containing protein [Halomonas]MYL25689.1 DUF1631 family protein [Halomonas utahensis]MYL76036.1 DUF1631 family protein [Halomonas sp. 22501_18_FS]
MSRGENVVTLGQSGEGRQLPSPLISLRDRAAVRFRTLLDAFFDSADDALFDLSERSRSNAEQTTYFDAMRELRMQRKSMTLAFQQWLSRAFNEGGHFEPAPGRHSEGESDLESLSLVEDDDLEEQVAVDNMIQRIRNRYTDQVELLRQRVAELLRNPELASSRNPLGPEVICHGLAEACSSLSIDIRSRLVIYKLFDKLLINQLDNLYTEANQHLSDEGVLPNLKNPMPQRQRRNTSQGAPAGTAGQTSSGPASGDGAEQSSGTDIRSLIEMMHSGGGQGGGMPSGSMGAGQGFPVIGAGQGATPVQTSELVQMLSGVQLSAEASQAGGMVPVVQGLVNSNDRNVRQVDSDVINLVSMLFDFILEDRRLPETMQALIGRLQIPMVKVALVDPAFFERGGHPARKLLNELSSAALVWNEGNDSSRDPLYEKMESAVSRILNEYSDDVSVFESVLDDFTAFMEKDRRRRELVEQRLRDAEEGRARDEQARAEVERFLSEARARYTVPESLQGFLESAWFRVLKWHYLREGDEGEGWKAQCELTDRLLWSLDPAPFLASTRSVLLREIPGIVRSVRESLEKIGWDPFETDRSLHQLELVHVDVLQRLKTAPKEEAPQETTGGSELDLTSEAPPGLAEASGDELAAEQPLEAPAEVVPEQPEEEAEAVTPPDLSVGAWLTWQPPEGSPVRCKLAAVIRATGKYIFVNRNGARVVEYMMPEVNQALADGTLEMLDDGLIFDRALESVIDSLRQGQTA